MELGNLDSYAIDSYTVSSLSAAVKLKSFLNIGAVTFSVRIDNLFNKKYETSGYGWNYGRILDNGLIIG